MIGLYGIVETTYRLFKLRKIKS